MPFFVVCYEDNRTMIVTKDCSAANIVNYLAQNLPWHQPEYIGADIDLCDATGKVIGLRYMGNVSVGHSLVERSMYYPVLFKDDKPTCLLLSTAHKNYTQLLAQVTKFCSTTQEDSSTKKNISNTPQDKRKKGRTSPKGRPKK